MTNLSLGTNVCDEKKKKDIMSIIIKRSSELPAYGEKIYKTKEDNQTSILNEIYEGENEELSENLLLGTLIISNLPKRKKAKSK